MTPTPKDAHGREESAGTKSRCGTTDVKVGGLGGQGAVTLARTIAVAALRDGHAPVLGQVRRASRRRGNVECDVRFSDRAAWLDARIPPGEADLILSLGPSLGALVAGYASPRTVVIQLRSDELPDDLVQQHADQVAELYLVDGKSLAARDQPSQVANMAILAAVLRTGALALTREAIEGAIRADLKREWVSLNLEAFARSMEDLAIGRVECRPAHRAVVRDDGAPGPAARSLFP